MNGRTRTAALLAACTLGAPAAAQAAPGDINVTTSTAILRVDAVSGVRSVVSGDGAGSGPAFSRLEGLAFAANGDLIAADRDAVPAGTSPFNGAIFRVNVLTGARTIIASNAIGTGPQFRNPLKAIVTASGDLFVLDVTAGDDDCIFKVAVATGTRSLLSCTGAPGTGPDLNGANDLVVAPDGRLLVTDSDLSFGKSEILAVDPVTGARSTVSSNTHPSGTPELHVPVGLAVDAAGDLVVPDQNALTDTPFAAGGEAVLRVNATTGMRALISSNATPAGGPSLSTPQAVALAADGDILIPDNNGSTDGASAAILRVDPATGERQTVSENAAPAGGASLGGLSSIAVQPGVPGTIPTYLKANPSVLRVNGLQLFLSFSATLTAGPARTPLAGRTVRFTGANGPLCTGVTNAAGLASCGDALAVLQNLSEYRAAFDGGAPYAHVRATGAVLE
jgi:sugar lactone lactonase YvrE